MKNSKKTLTDVAILVAMLIIIMGVFLGMYLPIKSGNAQPNSYSHLSLLMGGGDNEVTATVKNDLTTHRGNVEVSLYLYSSNDKPAEDSYREPFTYMKEMAVARSENLKAGKSIKVSGSTGRVAKYWCARMVYSIDGAPIEEKYTTPAKFAPDGSFIKKRNEMKDLLLLTESAELEYLNGDKNAIYTTTLQKNKFKTIYSHFKNVDFGYKSEIPITTKRALDGARITFSVDANKIKNYHVPVSEDGIIRVEITVWENSSYIEIMFCGYTKGGKYATVYSARSADAAKGIINRFRPYKEITKVNVAKQIKNSSNVTLCIPAINAGRTTTDKSTIKSIGKYFNKLHLNFKEVDYQERQDFMLNCVGRMRFEGKANNITLYINENGEMQAMVYDGNQTKYFKAKKKINIEKFYTAMKDICSTKSSTVNLAEEICTQQAVYLPLAEYAYSSKGLFTCGMTENEEFKKGFAEFFKDVTFTERALYRYSGLHYALSGNKKDFIIEKGFAIASPYDLVAAFKIGGYDFTKCVAEIDIFKDGSVWLRIEQGETVYTLCSEPGAVDPLAITEFVSGYVAESDDYTLIKFLLGHDGYYI